MNFLKMFKVGQTITVDPRETFTVRTGEIIHVREDMFTVKYGCGFRESFNRGQFGYVNIITLHWDYIAGKKYPSGTWVMMKEEQKQEEIA